MQSRARIRQLLTAIWLMTVLVGITLLAFSASAQNISLGQQEYERLKQTQIEYQQAVAARDSLEMAELSYRLGKRIAA